MFIPVEKMKKLREAAKSGDANASRILAMQMKGDDGLEEAVSSYFEPKPEPEPEPEKKHWMDGTLTAGQPGQEWQAQDTTAELAQGIVQLISVCDKTIMAFANGNELSGATMKGTLGTLQEIKQSLLDAMEKVKGLKPKVENQPEQAL